MLFIKFFNVKSESHGLVYYRNKKILPSAPLLLLTVWDGVDGQEGQGEREIPAQVKGHSHGIKRGLCNLLEFTPGQVKGQSHGIKRGNLLNLESLPVFKKIVSCKFETSEIMSYYKMLFIKEYRQRHRFW
jgi:hypothetical protein